MDDDKILVKAINSCPLQGAAECPAEPCRLCRKAAARIGQLHQEADFARELANGERAANDRLQERLRMADAECAGLRREIDRLTAESRAKEQYIAEHMGGTAERNARMRRDAERLRGTGAHAFADGDGLVLKDEYT